MKNDNILMALSGIAFVMAVLTMASSYVGTVKDVAAVKESVAKLSVQNCKCQR